MQPGRKLASVDYDSNSSVAVFFSIYQIWISYNVEVENEDVSQEFC